MRRLTLAFLLGLAACGSHRPIGNGFELFDGGGSKLSLARDGLILISNTVTGHGKMGGHDIIESKPYGSSKCEYYFIGSDRQLVRLGDGHSPISAAEAAGAVRPLMGRSCRSGAPIVDGAERNLPEREETALIESAIAPQAGLQRTSVADVRSTYMVAARSFDRTACVDLRYGRVLASTYCYRLEGRRWPMVSEWVGSS